MHAEIERLKLLSVVLKLKQTTHDAEEIALIVANGARNDQYFAPGAPENRIYLDYYRAMGMDPARAAAFYAMTNSVPFASARWLTAVEMKHWAGIE